MPTDNAATFIPPNPAATDVKNWTPEMRAQAMQALINSPGWLLMKHILYKGEKRRWQNELEGGKHKELAEVENLQYKISVIKQLFALPITIIAEPTINNLDLVAQKMKEFDPYDDEDEDEEENES